MVVDEDIILEFMMVGFGHRFVFFEGSAGGSGRDCGHGFDIFSSESYSLFVGNYSRNIDICFV